MGPYDEILERAGTLSVKSLLILLLTSPLLAGPIPDNVPNQVLHYHLDAGAGTHVADSSDKGVPCTIGGAVPPVWVTGVYSNALYFSGGAGQTCITASNALINVSSFTIAAWVKPDKTLDSDGDRGMSIAAQWAIGYGSYYSLRLEYGFVENDVGGDGPADCIGTVVITTGVWSHIAVVRRAALNRRELYVNGKLDKVCGTGPHKVGGTDPFSLGSDTNNDGMNYVGAMDEVVLLQRDASEGEIASWYAQGLGRHAQ